MNYGREAQHKNGNRQLKREATKMIMYLCIQVIRGEKEEKKRGKY